MWKTKIVVQIFGVEPAEEYTGVDLAACPWQFIPDMPFWSAMTFSDIDAVYYGDISNNWQLLTDKRHDTSRHW